MKRNLTSGGGGGYLLLPLGYMHEDNNHFQRYFISKATWLIKGKVHMEPPWEVREKIYINGPGHITKMATLPIYGKNLQIFLLQNQMPYDHDTWHGVFCTQVLQSLYK